MFERRVVGVDPGLSRCGVAVVDGPAHRAVTVDSAVVRTAPGVALGQRLREICDDLTRLVEQHSPAALAVERVFINAQARTGAGAMQVVGLVHLIGARAGLPVTEYTPSQVKAAVTGVGDADKDQVTFMVQRMLRLSEPPTPADRADAMAVALCHLHQPGHLYGGTKAAAETSAPGTVRSDAGTAPQPTGMSPRLAAALAAAGPGLQRVVDRRGPSNP